MECCQNYHHDDKFTPGRHWYCNTCGLTRKNGKCLCDACAKICHKGHDLVVENRGKYYCDCGNYCGSSSCRCCEHKQVCSKVVYAKRGGQIEQRAWECLTCGTLICSSCKERCHIGHKLADEGLQLFTCECEECCKCKAKEEVSENPVPKRKMVLESFKIADRLPAKTETEEDRSFSLNSCKLSTLKSIIKSIPSIEEHKCSIIINETFSFKIPTVIAAFVSSKIAKELESDPTINAFSFNIEASSASLNTIKEVLTGDSELKLKSTDIEAFKNFGAAIGNEEFVQLFKRKKKLLDNLIDENNAIAKLESKIDLEITDYSQETSFIASHFDEFCKKKEFIKFSMNYRNYNIVESLLGSSELRTSSEDNLLKFILTISKDNAHKNEYARLFGFVYLEYCSAEMCKAFLDFAKGLVSSATMHALFSCMGRRIIQSSIPMKSLSNNDHIQNKTNQKKSNTS